MCYLCVYDVLYLCVLIINTIWDVDFASTSLLAITVHEVSC